MCDRASYMQMTRGTNLMQQLWFILISSLYMFRTSICPSSGVQVVYCWMWCSALGVVAVVLRSRCVVLCTVCEFVSNWHYGCILWPVWRVCCAHRSQYVCCALCGGIQYTVYPHTVHSTHVSQVTVCSHNASWIQTHTQCTRLHTGSLGPQPQHLVLNTTCSSTQPALLKMDIQMSETCRFIYDYKS